MIPQSSGPTFKRRASLFRVNFRAIVRLPGVGLLLVLLVACGKDPTRIAPTQPPTLTAAVGTTSIPATPVERRTLPPTWTLEPTLTPIPPRPTATATLSPTPVPTLTATQICTGFVIISAPAEASEFAYDGTTSFAWHGVPDGAVLSLSISRNDNGKEAFRINLPVAGDSLLTLPMARLPSEGRYNWKIWLQHPQYGDICTHTGMMLRKSPPTVF